MSADALPRGLEKVYAYAAAVIPPGGVPGGAEMLVQINEHTFGLNKEAAVGIGIAIMAAALDAGWIEEQAKSEEQPAPC